MMLRYRSLPPYGPASALAAVVLCAIDAALTRPVADASTWFAFACLTAVVGFGHGVLWQAAFTLLSPLPRWLQLSLWPIALLLIGASLADELGAFARLGSRHRGQALAVLGAIALAALLASVLLWLLQPSARHPRGILFGLRPRVRLAGSAALAVAAALVFYVDRRYYAGLYVAAHWGLRAACLLLTMLAVALAASTWRLPWLRSRWLAAAVALLIVPVAVSEVARPQALLALSSHAWAGDVIAVAQAATDVDRDGYSSLFGGGDCAELDAAIHPGAHEVPGNGVDDNCVLGDRQEKPISVDVIEPARLPALTDVVLITIDTLRPDHLGVYSRAYGPKRRNTSPNLDRWAATGASVFRNAFTTGAWTVLALSSVLRGVSPRRVQWTPFFETSRYRLVPKSDAKKLHSGETLLHMFLMPSADTHVTLPTLLQRRGMTTIAVVDDGYSTMLHGSGGFDRGFDEYINIRPSPTPPDEVTATRAINVLRRIDPRERYFLWVHLFGPHSPNEARPDVPSYGPSIADGYDHEVRFMDLHLGRLLDALSTRKPQPIVIVTGDHGEYFGPTNRWHGYSLEEDTMRIPLLIKMPGVKPRKIRDTVSLADLFPTILALTNTPGPKHSIDGVNLLPLLRGQAGEPRIVLTDCWRYSADGTLAMDSVGATDGRRFVFYDRLSGTAFSTATRSREARWLSESALMGDPLGRYALGYLEEVAALPR
jgi:arylsulfatase A-like enzyme